MLAVIRVYNNDVHIRSIYQNFYRYFDRNSMILIQFSLNDLNIQQHTIYILRDNFPTNGRAVYICPGYF